MLREHTEAVASSIEYGGGASAETGFGWTPSSIENGDIRWDDPNYLNALNGMSDDEFIHWSGLTVAAYSFLGPDNPIFRVVSFEATIDLASEGRTLTYGLSYADMAASYMGPGALENRGYLGPQSNLRTFHTPVDECSFSAETGVLMADGTTKPISQIVVGDKVLAYDPTTGERGPREVTHLWVHTDLLTELQIDGAKVVTTEDHPFWSVTDGEWERADELAVGETVLASDGTLLRVGGLVLTSARLGSAYNLTVAGLHTYYVAVGDEAVLVHNDCGNFVTSPSKVANKLGVTTQEVNNAIHEMKKAIPSGAPIRNPDVTVDMGTGEVYPQISGGGLGDSIGNIFDYFPQL